MKSVLTSFAFLLAACAFVETAAAGAMHWSETGRTAISSRTREEFERLQRLYPQEFGRMHAGEVDVAQITAIRYELRGDSACAKDDPRARSEARTISVCFKDGRCMSAEVSHPTLEKDPCAP